MQIAEGITLIEGVGANSNCYLVECAGGVNVLVDTGTADNFLRIKEHVKKLDVIVNTHCHYDHVGGNLLVKNEFGAKLLAHEEDAPYISSGDGEHTCFSMFGKVLSGVKVDIVLKDRDVILGTTGLEVVHTPGHTGIPAAGSAFMSGRGRYCFQGILCLRMEGSGARIFPGGIGGRLLHLFARFLCLMLM